MNIRTSDRFGFFQVATGTSVAAPHAGGALALLLSAHPNLTADQQMAALLASAADLGAPGPDDTFGAGRIDVLAAHQWLIDHPPTQSPTVTSIAPASGPTSGGTSVAITGTGFSTSNAATTVTFGAAPAVSVSCTTSTSCNAVSPAGSVGTVDLQVTVGAQVSQPVVGDRFTYVTAPTPTTDLVVVPNLARDYGFWVTVSTTASGSISASWAKSAASQGTLAIYAGAPFAGSPDPVKRNPPAGALASSSGKKASHDIVTSSRPAGVYTVFYFAGANTPASSGAITSTK